MKYRLKMVEWGERNQQNADDLWLMGKRDPLWAMGTFFYTYDPRRPGNKVVPFIPYPIQERAILTLFSWIDNQIPGTGKKSRDVGFTWMVCYVAMHYFLFDENSSILFGSRKKEFVDKRGDRKCIFWKLDHTIKWLPRFLTPPVLNNKGERARTEMHWENFLNGATIDGESTNEDFGRGDRRTAVFPDEFASVKRGADIMAAVRDTSPCVIPFSTPKGTNTEFFRLNQNQTWGYMFVHWSEIPGKRDGLYRVNHDHTIEILDKAWHKKHPGYAFASEPGLFKGLRSPWYDREALSRSRLQLAQEVDGDDNASGNQFMDTVRIQEILDDVCMPPISVGNLLYNTETYEPVNWHDTRHGLVKLWDTLTKDEAGIFRPDKAGEFSVGVDVAVGTGASNSTFHVTNKRTMTTFATFASPNIRPASFAELVVPICKWLNNAYLVWEANGPGREFGQRVMELGYMNVYFRRREESLSKQHTDTPGWWSTGGIDGSKRQLLGEYARLLETGEFTNLDEDSVKECMEIVIQDDGGVGHSGETGGEDPAGARSNHADRVISAALSVKGAFINPASRPDEKEDEPPMNSHRARRLQYEEQLRGASEW